MSIETFAMIILFFAVMSIGMTLLATYYVALYKEERRKNRALMQQKSKKEKKNAKRL